MLFEFFFKVNETVPFFSNFLDIFRIHFGLIRICLANCLICVHFGTELYLTKEHYWLILQKIKYV